MRIRCVWIGYGLRPPPIHTHRRPFCEVPVMVVVAAMHRVFREEDLACGRPTHQRSSSETFHNPQT